MTLPFLHNFLSRTAGASRPKSATYAWPLSLIGVDGAQMLAFTIMHIGETAPRKPGLFIYARRTSGHEWQALYIGESANLRARLAFNEIAADALLSGATDIHLLQLNADVTERRDLCDRLIGTNHPPLNEEQRVKFDAIVHGPIQRTPKGKPSRAA